MTNEDKNWQESHKEAEKHGQKRFTGIIFDLGSDELNRQAERLVVEAIDELDAKEGGE